MQNSYRRFQQNNNQHVNLALPNSGPENSLVCSGNVCCRVERDPTDPVYPYHILCWNSNTNKILVNKNTA
jgi:hypothetical protein